MWGGPIASPVMVGGDTLIGEDEVTAVPEDKRDLMKGDPLRGVHAFYSASAREWWAPLRPDHRVFRRNAAVAVLDKPSEFAGRAIHEWSANVFQADDGTILSGQYRLMIRTEREKAQEKGKYKDVEFRRYTDDEIDAIDAQYAAQAESRRGAEPRVLGGRLGRRRGRSDGQGPAHRHRHGVLARRHGHGPLRRARARPRGPEPQAHPALLPPRRAERARRDAARALGPGVRAQVGQPHHVRLRPHARDVARPPLHQLDGRRRVALEARLRVPGLQLRRATPNGCGGTVIDKFLADGDRPAVHLELRAESQRGELTTPGHATILLPSREHGPVRLPDPPGGAKNLEQALAAISAEFATR